MRTSALLAAAMLLLGLFHAAAARFEFTHNTGFWLNDFTLENAPGGPIRKTMVAPEEVLECLAQLVLMLPAALLAGAALAPRLHRHRPPLAALARGNRLGGLALAIALLAFVIAGQVLEFTHITDDEFVNAIQSRILLMGKLWLPLEIDPSLTRNNLLVHADGRYYGHFLPGWAALLAPGTALGNPYLVSAACGAGALVASAAAWRAAGACAALAALAVLHLAISPLLVLNAATLLNTIPSLMVLALFLAAALLADAGRGRGWSALCGLMLALSLFMRPLTALAWGSATAVYLLARSPTRATLGRHLPALLVFAGAIAALLGLNRLLTGSPFMTPYTRFNPTEGLGFGVRGWAQILHDPARGGFNAIIAGVRLCNWLFGWPCSFVFLPFAFVGSSSAIPMRGLWSCLVAAHAAAYFFYYFPGLGFTGPHYYAELLLPLAMLSAGGLLRLHRLAQASSDPRIAGLPAALAVTLTLSGALTFTPAKLEQLAMLATYTQAPYRAVDRANLGDAVVFLTPHLLPAAEGFVLGTRVVHPALATPGTPLYLNDPPDRRVRDRYLEALGGTRKAYVYDWKGLRQILPQASRETIAPLLERGLAGPSQERTDPQEPRPSGAAARTRTSP